jgi:hypothetical protein
MTVIVQSERWCEIVLAKRAGDCARCGDVATAVCEACGSAVCDAHEKVCAICGGSCCGQCEHACYGGDPIKRAA